MDIEGLESFGFQKDLIILLLQIASQLHDDSNALFSPALFWAYLPFLAAKLLSQTRAEGLQCFGQNATKMLCTCFADI